MGIAAEPEFPASTMKFGKRLGEQPREPSEKTKLFPQVVMNVSHKTKIVKRNIFIMSR